MLNVDFVLVLNVDYVLMLNLSRTKDVRKETLLVRH